MAQAQEPRKGISNETMAEQSLAEHAGAHQVARGEEYYMQRDADD